jgi:hypothetical protein
LGQTFVPFQNSRGQFGGTREDTVRPHGRIFARFCRSFPFNCCGTPKTPDAAPPDARVASRKVRKPEDFRCFSSWLTSCPTRHELKCRTLELQESKCRPEYLLPFSQ